MSPPLVLSHFTGDDDDSSEFEPMDVLTALIADGSPMALVAGTRIALFRHPVTSCCADASPSAPIVPAGVLRIDPSSLHTGIASLTSSSRLAPMFVASSLSPSFFVSRRIVTRLAVPFSGAGAPLALPLGANSIAADGTRAFWTRRAKDGEVLIGLPLALVAPGHCVTADNSAEEEAAYDRLREGSSEKLARQDGMCFSRNASHSISSRVAASSASIAPSSQSELLSSPLRWFGRGLDLLVELLAANWCLERSASSGLARPGKDMCSARETRVKCGGGWTRAAARARSRFASHCSPPTVNAKTSAVTWYHAA